MEHSPAHLEAIEREAWLDLYAAAPAGFAQAVGLSSARLDNGAAILAAARVPDTQFNRILGLGIEAPASEAALDAALARMREAGNPNFLLHLEPTALPPALADWLSRRGLERYRRPWGKFVRGTEPVPHVAIDLAIEEIGPDRAKDFAVPVAAGFGAPPPFQLWLAALPGRPGWRIYAAYEAGVAIAGAALFIRDRQGWYGIAATDPAKRRRGAQRAVLARLLGDAIAAGCDLIVAETGAAVPGEPNSSWNNMERSGFRVAYLRENYRPAANS